jgi:benzylsuccinate CoA-transferase BbsE subunit
LIGSSIPLKTPMLPPLLNGFRMLDLSDDRGAMCGKIFVDLGAEVIKIEPSNGCPTRRIPPFLDGEAGEDRSLYFLAHQAGKLSVTANLDSSDGRAVVRDLAARADFIVESSPAGYMDSIGLGYEAFAESNPRLIYAAIMPFGEDGPGRDYKAYEAVSWAAGGMMFLMGEPGRPPLQMSLPQVGLHAGAEAAIASLLAHFARQSDGRGQWIVINLQACIVWTLMNEQAMPIMHGDFLRRQGVYLGSPKLRRKFVFRCKDGFVAMMITGGAVGSGSTRRLVEWMDEKGFAADWMKHQDWSAWTPAVFMALNERDLRENAEMESSVERFFGTMTKHELYAEGARRGVLLGPVMSAADTAADEQLAARGFFVDVDHPALGRMIRRPGAFAKFSRTPLAPPRPAPRLGEHNAMVYGSLLGYSAERIAQLRASGAI